MLLRLTDPSALFTSLTAWDSWHLEILTLQCKFSSCFKCYFTTMQCIVNLKILKNRTYILYHSLVLGRLCINAGMHMICTHTYSPYKVIHVAICQNIIYVYLCSYLLLKQEITYINVKMPGHFLHICMYICMYAIHAMYLQRQLLNFIAFA